MRVTQKIHKILSAYESDNPGTLTNLARFLCSGRLGNTGRMLILPVDQGFEHGPDRSFALNPDGMDPCYHYKLAVDAGLSGYAAPLGMLEAGARTFAGAIPTILKMNSANLLPRAAEQKTHSDQAITASVDDAIRLGCSGVGFTIYPGSDQTYAMFEELKDLAYEAKAKGLAVVVWAYPRGNISQPGETAVDVISYGAHMAALLGAHIIKVKLPSDHVESKDIQEIYTQGGIDLSTLAARIKQVVASCFQGRRLVVFSGGAHQKKEEIYGAARAICEGDGNGLIIGRNTFQRPREEALEMLKALTDIFRG